MSEPGTAAVRARRSRTALCSGVLAVRAGGAGARAEAPAATEVLLSLSEASPIIGVTGETQLRIEVAGPHEDTMPLPRVLCSVGQIEDLGRVGPASFTARYILPASRYPQPVIIAAEFPRPGQSPVRGKLAAALRAATTPTFRTDPGSKVVLRVGDRDFGPHLAGPDGVVHIPAVVPPGVESGIAQSVNRYGRATTQEIPLRVPYSQRLLVVAPQSLAAGHVGEVAVYVVDPSGNLMDAGDVVVRAPGKRIVPLGGVARGEVRFLVAAPAILKSPTMLVEAQIKDKGTTRVVGEIRLVPGPAVGLTLEPETTSLRGGSSLRVFLGAEDAYGNPVDAGPASVVVDGVPTTVRTAPQGEPMIVVDLPPAELGKDVVVEAVLDRAYASRVLPSPRPPAPVVVRRVPARTGSRYWVTPRIALLWDLARESGVGVFVDATAFRSARLPDTGIGVSLGALQTAFATDSVGSMSRTSLTTVPILLQLTQRHLWDRSFVAAGGGIGAALSVARIESYGSTVTGAGYGAALEAHVEAGFRLRKGQLALSARYLALYLSELSSGDRIAGRAGGPLVDAGYRFSW